VAPQVILARVAKASVGIVCLHLEDIFAVEEGERLRLEFGKMRVEESEKGEVE